MLISATELSLLLKRVFEGLGYSQGQYEDAAAMTSWLPLHGENDLEALAPALDRLGDHALTPSELAAPDAGVLSADCHGRSALNCLPSLLDLACQAALEQGGVQLDIARCGQRKFILKLLTDCAGKGLWAQVLWKDEAGRASCHAAWIEAGADYPAYQVGSLPGQAPRPGSLTLAMGLPGRARPRQDIDAMTITRHVTPADFALARRHTLEHGAEVSEAMWQRLNLLAQAVLVENSERSRGGAGGR